MENLENNGNGNGNGSEPHIEQSPEVTPRVSVPAPKQNALGSRFAVKAKPSVLKNNRIKFWMIIGVFGGCVVMGALVAWKLYERSQMPDKPVSQAPIIQLTKEQQLVKDADILVFSVGENGPEADIWKKVSEGRINLDKRPTEEVTALLELAKKGMGKLSEARAKKAEAYTGWENAEPDPAKKQLWHTDGVKNLEKIDSELAVWSAALKDFEKRLGVQPSEEKQKEENASGVVNGGEQKPVSFKSEGPGAESQKPETPVTPSAKPEQPTEPVTSEEPKIETPAEPVVEQPKSEEPVAEPSKAEEPKPETPVAESVEEPKPEEPVVEAKPVESSAAEPAEPVAEPTPAETPVETPVVEEPKAEVARVEEPKPEEPRAEPVANPTPEPAVIPEPAPLPVKIMKRKKSQEEILLEQAHDLVIQTSQSFNTLMEGIQKPPAQQDDLQKLIQNTTVAYDNLNQAYAKYKEVRAKLNGDQFTYIDENIKRIDSINGFLAEQLKYLKSLPASPQKPEEARSAEPNPEEGKKPVEPQPEPVKEPAPEEPKAEPKPEEPRAEPAPEQPKPEEPKAEEPKNEPQPEQPKSEEPAPGQPENKPVEEPKPEEPQPAEPAPNDAGEPK